MEKDKKKIMISLYVSEDDAALIDRLCKELGMSSRSGLLRYLAVNAGKNFLQSNTAIAVKNSFKTK